MEDYKFSVLFSSSSFCCTLSFFHIVDCADYKYINTAVIFGNPPLRALLGTAQSQTVLASVDAHCRISSRGRRAGRFGCLFVTELVSGCFK